MEEAASLDAGTGPERQAPDSLTYIDHAIAEKMLEHSRHLDAWAESFRTAAPFPHLVIDDFLPAELAEALASTFPQPGSPIWAHLPTEDQRKKLAASDDAKMPALQRHVLRALNSGGFLKFLEKLTGIDSLIADTTLAGGGMHQILPGGKLAVHIDFSHHPKNKLFRRLNLLLYLNKDWPEDYGGHLELWDKSIQRAEVKVLPAFNRMAVFATSNISFHGHPEPLRCPPGRTRKSMALYYFTKDPPPGREAVLHNTTFKSRPGDSFNLGNFLVRTASSGLLREAMPPFLYRGLQNMWNSRSAGK